MGRYAEYKDSGLEWIGEIPAHWKCQRLKFTVQLVNEKSVHDDNFYIGMENIESWTGKYLDMGEVAPESMCNKFCVNDILFGKLRPYLAKTYIAEKEGICSSEFLVFRTKSISHSYLFYILLSYAFIEHINSSTYGIKMPRANWDFIGKCYIPIPPQVEQSKIVHFLDANLRGVDQLIKNSESQLSMLTRYKRDLIAECVTKGLNKSAQMKPSGEDWIGNVPEHWNITKLKWMFEIVKRIYGKEDRDVLAITQQGIKLKDMESNKGQYAESYATYQVVNVNDFAMNSMDLLTGWVDCSPYEGVTSPDYRVFRFYEDKLQCHAYFKYLFQMCYTNRIFYRLGQGVSNLGRWRLQTDQFRNIKLPQPPVAEQEQIAAYLDEKTRQIDAVAADIEAQIQKLKDYRRILIHDAVTGKIKI